MLFFLTESIKFVLYQKNGKRISCFIENMYNVSLWIINISRDYRVSHVESWPFMAARITGDTIDLVQVHSNHALDISLIISILSISVSRISTHVELPVVKWKNFKFYSSNKCLNEG